MGDAADMLGLSPKKGDPISAQLGAGEAALNILAGQPKAVQKVKVKKPKGMSREVFDLMRNEDGVITASAAAALPTQSGAALGFKSKRTTALHGKWVWEPIHSSARSDQTLKIFHWTKAEMRHADYPWTKFNVPIKKLTYTDEIYQSLLVNADWTRRDTDLLMEAVGEYDTRWQVVSDRISGCMSVYHTLQDMKERYFSIVTALQRDVISNVADSSSGVTTDDMMSNSTVVVAAASDDDNEETDMTVIIPTAVVPTTAAANNNSFTETQHWSEMEKKRRLHADLLFYRCVYWHCWCIS